MKINSLEMKNFGIYADARVEFVTPITIIVGSNGAGKTMVVDGIRAAIEGTARGLLRGDAKELSTFGSNSWKTTIRLAGHPFEIARTPTTLRKVEEQQKPTLTQAELEAILGAPLSVVGAVFDASACLRLSPEKRRELLFPLANLTLTADDLRARGLTNEKSILAALSGDWAKAKRICEEERAGVGRAMKEVSFPKPEAPTVRFRGVDRLASEFDEDAVRSMRSALEGLRDGIAQRNRAIGAAEEKARAPARAAELDEELVKLRDQFGGRDLDDIQKKIGQVRERHETAMAELDAMVSARMEEDAEWKAVKKIVEQTEGELAVAKAAEKPVGSHSCPICGLEHESAPKKQATGAIRRRLDVAKKAFEEAKGPLEEAKGLEEEKRGAVQHLRAQIQRGEVIEAETKRLLAEIASVESRLTKLREVESDDSLEALRSELAVEEATLSAGEAVVKTVVDHVRAMEDWKRVQARSDGLKAEHEEADRQVRLCGPDGIPNDLLSPLLDRVRARFEAWRPVLDEVGMPVELTPSLEVLAGNVPVGWDGARWTGLPSESQMWRISAALTDSVAQISGLRFMVLDEAAVLDPQGRATLLRTLVSLAGDYDQILACVTLNEVMPSQAPNGCGARILLAQGGSVLPI
uniref:Putative ATPase domain containing protein n=1 Tax=viral metagenome TaxID=1070528 RepID=A0A6H1ZCQ8_9ZZZZ